eukprot:g7000.t1
MPHFTNRWQSEILFDCLNDIDICIVTISCPCLVFADNRNRLHGGPTNGVHSEGIDPCLAYCIIMTISACTLQCLYAYSTRTDIRRKYDLAEQPCDDCLTHVCCHFCALCQEYRELKYHPLTQWPAAVASGQEVILQRPQLQQIPDHRFQDASCYTQQQQARVQNSEARYPIPYANYQVQQQLQVTGQTSHPVPPPRPLVYERPRMPGQFGHQLPNPQLPALVYQVPRYSNNHPPQV